MCMENLGAKEWIAIVGVLITLCTVIKGVFEYTKAQRWKRAEFLAKEVKELFND